jgi:transposase-like protein
MGRRGPKKGSGGRKPTAPWIIARALEMVRSGASVTVVAEHVETDRRTISRWFHRVLAW